MRGERQTGAPTTPVASPQWFGPTERRLFGWVHRPAGANARAVVVVCPSLGQEAVFSHYTLRQVAESLAERGFVAVRFNYDGTGDSLGADDDPDRVRAWLDSIAAAVELGRSHCAAPVALLGFRLGALLAVEAADRADVLGAPVDALALWDSPRSGRGFLRERVIQQNVSVGGADLGHDTFTALGMSLDGEAQRDLSALDLRRRETLPVAAAVSLDRPGRLGPAIGVTTRDGAPIHRIEATDQDDLLLRQTLPLTTQGALLDWFEATYPDPAGPLLGVEAPATSVAVPGGTEQVLPVGPHALFGIVAEPDRRVSTTTVVFVPDSYTPHTGLNRVWADLARDLAAEGVRSMRFDLNGCGDSPVRPGGGPGHTIGLTSHLDDVADALRAASPGDPSDTIAIGLCSGGYLSMEGAFAVRPRAIGLVNPVFSFVTAEAPPSSRRRAIIVTRPLPRLLFGRIAGRIAERLSRTNTIPAFMDEPTFAWNRAFEACFWQAYLTLIRPGLPDLVWRLINKTLATQTSDRIFSGIRAAGTEVLLVAGDPDFERATLGSRRRLLARRRRGDLRLEHLPGLDHAMMRPGMKQEVSRSLTSFVLDVAGRSPSHPPADPANPADPAETADSAPSTDLAGAGGSAVSARDSTAADPVA